MGRDYYFDTAGSDDNDGSTPDSPLHSFACLRNRMLQPGDRVLLRRGCIFDQLLELRGQGTPEAFIQVTGYGEEDARPVIRRGGQIWERCVRLNDASYVRVSGLEVSHAGAGIVLFYDRSYGNRSVYLEDIVAHDFYGIYRASGQSSRNPEWQAYTADDRVGFSMGICVTGRDTTPDNDRRVLTDFRVTDCEIYKTGGGIGLDWCDHRCCDGSVTGSNKFGDVMFDRLYLHDNDVPDVSLTSMFLQCVTGAVFSNSVIDNGAGGAPWGTAAVHLQLARRTIIDNVVIRNMPHTNVSDECGIDFESDVEDCLIRNCTFENNAGAAIEFLANFEISSMAVSRDVRIEDCRFIRNNWAALYEVPSQIHVQTWQHDNAPSGSIRNCVYVNPEGVGFLGGDGNIRYFRLSGNRALPVRREAAGTYSEREAVVV